jgi:hypothetical protein
MTEEVIRGLHVTKGLMEFLENKKDTRVCSGCKSISYRIVPQKENANLALPSFEVVDAASGRSSEVPEVFILHVYKCPKCNHLDFYSFNTITSIPK